MNHDYTAVLKNWSIRACPYTKDIRAHGEIYEDSKHRFNDGAEVATSAIEEVYMPDNETGEWYITTKNSIYKLEVNYNNNV